MNTLRIDKVSVVDSRGEDVYRGKLIVKSDIEEKTFQVEYKNFVNGFIHYHDLKSLKYNFRTHFGVILPIQEVGWYESINDNTLSLNDYELKLFITNSDTKTLFSLDLDIENTIQLKPEENVNYLKRHVVQETSRLDNVIVDDNNDDIAPPPPPAPEDNQNNDPSSHTHKWCFENFSSDHPTKKTTILQMKKKDFSVKTSNTARTTRSRIEARRVIPGCMPRMWRKTHQFAK